MTKIIVSHDVDHISSYEHYADLIIPKYLARAALELFKDQINFSEFILRTVHTARGKWNFIQELADFNNKKGIKSTFFFATAKGIGLSYTPQNAKPLVEYVLSKGHKVGIHGIERDNLNGIMQERNIFEEFYGTECLGIRLHYLAQNKLQLENISKAGYLYDSSIRGKGQSSVINNMRSFPLHTMDGDVILSKYRLQHVDTKKAVVCTINDILEAKKNNVDYYSLLFHDRYFSNANKTWMEWYTGVINWLIDNNYEFTTYEEVVSNTNPTKLSNN